MTRYAWTRGRSKVMHLTQYDRFGDEIPRALCGRTFTVTCNLPLGRPTCKTCAKVYAREAKQG